jgi:hypothetical protein
MSSQTEQASFDGIIQAIIAAVAGITLPIVLIPVVAMTGYSPVIEELGKALVIFFAVATIPSRRARYLVAVLFGMLFGISENFLYLNQLFQQHDLTAFALRFAWTMPMHVAMSLILFTFLMRGKAYGIVGVFVSILLHQTFNLLMTRLSHL